MGKDRAIRFTVHYVVDHGVWTPGEWRVRTRGQVKGYGMPTDRNLRTHCRLLSASTLGGGANEHLGPTKVLKAWVVDNQTGDTVASYERS